MYFATWMAKTVKSSSPRSAVPLRTFGRSPKPWWSARDGTKGRPLASSLRVSGLRSRKGTRSPQGFRLYHNVATNADMLQRLRLDLDQWIRLKELDPDRVQLIDQGVIWGLRTRASEGPDP